MAPCKASKALDSSLRWNDDDMASVRSCLPRYFAGGTSVLCRPGSSIAAAEPYQGW